MSANSNTRSTTGKMRPSAIVGTTSRTNLRVASVENALEDVAHLEEAADPLGRKQARIAPAANRGLAYPEEPRCLPGVQQTLPWTPFGHFAMLALHRSA